VNFLEHGRRAEKQKNNIYVKHIPKDNFTDDDLVKLFETFGEIISAVVLKDTEYKSKGFGFVCFARPEDADAACKKLKDKQIWEDKDLPALYVNFAMTKSERLEHLSKKKRRNVWFGSKNDNLC